MDASAIRRRIEKEALRGCLRAQHRERRLARERWVIAQVAQALAQYANGQNRLRDESEVFSDLRAFAGSLASNQRKRNRSRETIG